MATPAAARSNAPDTLSNTTDQAATDCVMATIFEFLLPFFLTAAGGNPETARAAIRQLIAAYNAATATELDLAGRIVGFSIAALDNLRLSMGPDLSDTKVLRYRANAVTLGRASDQARKALEAIRANPDQPYKTPRPSVAPAPEMGSSATPSGPAKHHSVTAAAATPATPSAPAQSPKAQIPTAAQPAQPPHPPLSTPTLRQSPLARGGATNTLPMDIEAMKRDARLLLDAFSKHGAPSAASIPILAEPAAMARAAARAAIAAIRHPDAG